jgi:hypothetical protein
VTPPAKVYTIGRDTIGRGRPDPDCLLLVIAKAEHSEKSSNPRYIETNIVSDPQKLYERRYCQRDERENRVKEQLMLFADRVSAHRWWADQWRQCLSAFARTLLEALRRLACQARRWRKRPVRPCAPSSSSWRQ